MTPVEKVARAISWFVECIPWEHLSDEMRQGALDVARVAIKSMEEPSEAMVRADVWVTDDTPVRVATWRAMIRAALEEKP